MPSTPTLWLEDHGSSLVELDEIVGYHLEQAALYKAELGSPDERLALRTGERLARAGRRLLAPGNELPAQRLLSRALDLTRPFRLDVGLEFELALTYHNDEPLRAAAMCDDAARASPGGGGRAAGGAGQRRRGGPSPLRRTAA